MLKKLILVLVMFLPVMVMAVSVPEARISVSDQVVSVGIEVTIDASGSRPPAGVTVNDLQYRVKWSDKASGRILKALQKSQKLLNARLQGTTTNKDALAKQVHISIVKNMNLDIVSGKLKTVSPPNTTVVQHYRLTSPKTLGNSNNSNTDIYNPPGNDLKSVFLHLFSMP